MACRYRVRLSVPRVGGQRAWGPVSGDFERRLAQQESATVAGPHVDSLTRRGRDYLRVTIEMTVTAADPAQALTVAWRAFLKAAGDDVAGWDAGGASAEVRPAQLSQKSPRSQGAAPVTFPQAGIGVTAENSPFAAVVMSGGSPPGAVPRTSPGRRARPATSRATPPSPRVRQYRSHTVRSRGL